MPAKAPNSGFQLDLVRPPAGVRRLLHDLHRQLRSAIADGRLQPGLRLPSTRAFARQFGISRNTALALYDLLLADGYLEARPGSGTFVAEGLRREAGTAGGTNPYDRRIAPQWREAATFLPAQDAPQFDLRLGLPDRSLFPFDVWRRLSNRVVRELARAPSSYRNAQGSPALRAAIARHISFTRAVACRAEDVVVAAGAQQGFDLIARLLVTPGETVAAVEDPGYPPLRAAFRAAGARIVPVPVDGDGMRVDVIPDEARIICVTPSHQFPTGVAMSLQRRMALLERARAIDASIIEDDYDSEFRFSSRPLDALQTLDRSGSVFYVGTFSKCLFPELRLGFVVAPAWALAGLAEVRRVSGWHGPVQDEEALAAFIDEGHLARYIRRMRKEYSARRHALIDALSRHCRQSLRLIPSAAGLHLAVQLIVPVAAAEVAAAARELGVAVDTLDRYSVGHAPMQGLALGFGQTAAGKLDAAAQLLQQAIYACLRQG